MWQCPKCNRQFRNTNQNHFCGKVETIDQYISEQAADVQPILNKIREVICAAAPEATGMYHLDGFLKNPDHFEVVGICELSLDFVKSSVTKSEYKDILGFE